MFIERERKLNKIILFSLNQKKKANQIIISHQQNQIQTEKPSNIMKWRHFHLHHNSESYFSSTISGGKIIEGTLQWNNKHKDTKMENVRFKKQRN